MPASQPHPPYEPLRLRHFLSALVQILAISLTGIALAAVVRVPSCPVKEPAHAWQR